MESWKRTYHAVWAANCVTAVGMMSFLPFFPGHLEELGLTDRGSIAAWAGVIYGAAPLAAAIMSPLWGALGDRYGRRLMVLRSMLAIAVFVGAMAFARGPWTLLALRILQGVFSGFVAPSLTLVSVQAPAAAQGRLSGSLQMAMTVGAIFGPAFGELVRTQHGVRGVYLAVALLALLSSGLVLAFARDDASVRRKRGPVSSPRAVLRESFGDLGELRRNRPLQAGVLLLFWIHFGVGATNPVLELHVRDVHSWLPWAQPSTAALFSALAVANLLALPLWGRYGDRHGHYPALLLCAAWTAAGLIAHALVPSYELLLLARIVLGAAMAGSGPLAFGIAAVESAVDRRGGAFGVVFAARALAISVSAMVGGWLSAQMGVQALFAGGGGLLALQLVLLRRRDRRDGVAAAPRGESDS